MNNNIVLFGGGYNCNVCIDIIEKTTEYNIVGIIDSKAEINSALFGYKVIGRQEDLISLIKSYKIDGGLVTVGDNYGRFLVSEIIKKQVPDFKFISAIHTEATVSKDTVIGDNAIIMANAVINPNAEIGDFCMINTGAQVEHDCIIEDFVHVSCGTIMGGLVHIGKFSFISIGSVIRDRIHIGENCIIGLGSLVLKDVPDNTMAFGTPAKEIKTIHLGYKFLK